MDRLKREPMMRPEPKPQPFCWQGGPLKKYFGGAVVESKIVSNPVAKPSK